MDKKRIKEIIIIIAVSVISAFTVNIFSPKGIAILGQWETSKGVVTAKAKDDIVIHELEINDVKLAKKIYDQGKTIFVDARSGEDYEDGHIPGAVSIPIIKFDEMISSFISKYPSEHPIITYCSGRNCEDSHKLAQLLLNFGFADVRVFIDGLPGWKAQGYPIE